jgi:DNA topoisomerase-3
VFIILNFTEFVSAITATEIKSAMTKLTNPNENEAKAVDVRQELDLKV